MHVPAEEEGAVGGQDERAEKAGEGWLEEEFDQDGLWREVSDG